MTVVSINQPGYLIYEGHLDRIARSDIHVVLDHVPMGKDGMFNRNRIAGGKMLTIPIKNRGDATPICDIRVAHDGKWQRRHLAAIEAAYSDAHNFEKHYPEIKRIINLPWNNAENIAFDMMEYFKSTFGIDTPISCSQFLNVKSRKSEMNLEICKIFKATTYLSGPFGREYLDRAAFEKAGIEIKFHEYPAGYSAIDALMHGRAIDKGVVKDE